MPALSNLSQFKQRYNAIDTYHSHSGVYWDNKHGENIIMPAKEAIWNEYNDPTLPLFDSPTLVDLLPLDTFIQATQGMSLPIVHIQK
jgi:hypothetical protein